ncbi:hypothetical protein V8E36_003532 [Tilletia maclaganii]
MHADQVVVMDQGKVVECGAPGGLLLGRREGSRFYQLCAASGAAELEKLRELAGVGERV